MLGAPQARAVDECPTRSDEIETDRPDVTNSSVVIPAGSLQAENGANFTAARRIRTIDATNTRLRLGLSACTEVLADLPSAVVTTRGRMPSGPTDLAPAIKHQFFKGPFSASGVFGVQLPTGSSRISGRGYAPYLQVPWARTMSDAWRLSGMVTLTLTPEEPKVDQTTQITFVIERELDERTNVFVEGIGDLPSQGHLAKRLNSGAAYKLTATHQVDFHVGLGLDGASPAWFVGIGYSLRLDALF